MENGFMSKILAMLLVVVLVVGMLPLSVLAASIDFDMSTGDDYYKLISKQDWELAPGIQESEIILNNAEGTLRQVTHVVEVDLNNPYTKVVAGYKEMVPTPGNYGTQSPSVHAAYAEENGYGNVVAVTNCSLSWYNDSYYSSNPQLIGEPLGYVILDGELVHTNSRGQNYGAVCCIVINYNEKEIDGVMTQRPEDMPRVTIRSTSDPITGWEEQVIPVNFTFLVKDTNGDGIGENQYLNKTYEADGTYEKYHTSGFESRTFVGVKADGTLVVAVSDGRQAPYSTGFNSYEMAEYMISLGCVVAANCDGGGSTAFLSERPGEDLKVNCSLSDGGERPTTNSILIISNAPANGEFARATLSTEYDYYTPGSTVTFNALATDALGNEVAMPEGITWSIEEDGMGTIDNGVFVSNGTPGTVTAQLWYDGEVVGERTITLAVPDALSFSQPVVTIPYGTRAMIPVKATINGGLHEIGLSPADVTVTIDNDALGTIDGLHFIGNTTAPADNWGEVTVSLNADPVVTANVSLKLGDASVVMWDFEDGTLGDWKAIVQRELNQSHRDFVHDLSIATREDGQVHDGDYSMRLETNGLSSSQVHSQQYAYVRLGLPDQEISLENARRLGFWLYVPEDNIQCWVQGFYRYDTDGDGTPDALAEVNMMNSENVYYNVDESGWHYMSMDLSGFDQVLLGDKWNVDPADPTGQTGDFFIAIIFHKAINNMLWQENGSINGPLTYYIDSVTVDYSEMVDDREAPVFGSITLNDNGTKTDLKKRGVVTTSNNVLNITAKVSEATERVAATGEKSPLYNYTGIDAATAKAYIDGVEVPCSYQNGQMVIQNVTVADGYHRVKFEICDNAGNQSVKIRVIEVESGVDASTIQVVPADPTLDRIYFGSVYWMDMVATNIETVQSVTAVLDLNSVNHWQLDNMELAYGFSAEYTINAETNTAAITITRTGTNTQTGRTVLAKLPVRIVSFDTDMNIPGYTAETVWTSYEFWPQDMKLDVDMGLITHIDGHTSTFSNEEFHVDTEMYTNKANMDKVYLAEHGTTHVHTPVALPDKAATCEYGYTDRTWCEVCDSVVEWGTTIAPVGDHDFQVIDGKLTCAYGGEVFNGVYKDGKTYVDGVIRHGWNEDHTAYYKDGVLLTGANVIDKVVYTFDEEGVYLPDMDYTGFITCDEGVMYFMNKTTYLTGYASLDLNTPYYFDEEGIGYHGVFVIGGETCTFEGGKFISCEDPDVLLAGWGGENVHFVVYSDGEIVLSGSGGMFYHKQRAMVPWQAHRLDIKKVTIGKDITELCRFAFTHGYNITEIVFEEGSKLETVGYQSFYYDLKVKSIVLPDTVKTIGWMAFGNWQNMQSIYLPDGVESINAEAFSGANANAVMQVAEGTYAHDYAVQHGFNVELRERQPVLLGSGSCGEGLTWALYDNGVLSIDGDGVMPDYHYGKYNANASPWAQSREQITKVVIGSGVKSIGTYAFYQCTALTEVEFAADSTLEAIGEGSFGYTGVTSICLPASLKTIGKCAFYFSALETVTVAEDSKLTEIGAYAFRDCIALKSVYLPDGVDTIGASIFYNCGDQVVANVAEGSYAHRYAVNNGYSVELREPLPSVKYSGTCGEGLTWELYDNGVMVLSGNGSMPDYHYAKYNANAAPWSLYRAEIVKVVVGSGVKSIGSYAFYQCTGLTEVEFAADSTLETIGEGSFGYTDISNICLPASLKTIGKCAFYFSSLETVTVADDSKLTTIVAYAFRDCTSLKSVYVPDGVSSIGSVIFYNCGDQVVMNVAEGSYAHKYATNNGYAVVTRAPLPAVKYSGTCGEGLTWALYDNGTLKLDGNGSMPDYHYAKYNANAAPWSLYRAEIVKVVVGSGVKSIGSYAFYQCTGLTEVEFAADSTLETIGEGSFGYTGLTEICLPASLKTIGKCAFYFADLETVTFVEGSQLTTIEAYAFRDCTSLKSVYIPASVKSIGSVIFYNCGDQVVMNVAEGSYAQQYATKNGYAVEAR